MLAKKFERGRSALPSTQHPADAEPAFGTLTGQESRGMGQAAFPLYAFAVVDFHLRLALSVNKIHQLPVQPFAAGVAQKLKRPCTMNNTAPNTSRSVKSDISRQKPTPAKRRHHQPCRGCLLVEPVHTHRGHAHRCRNEHAAHHHGSNVGNLTRKARKPQATTCKISPIGHAPR